MLTPNRVRRSGVLRVVYWLGMALLLYLSYYFLLPAAWSVFKFVAPLCVPFLLGLLLAALLDPLVVRVERVLKLGRTWAVLLVVLFFMGVIGFLITLAVLRLIVEVTKFTALLPGYSQAASTYFREFFAEARSIYATFDLPPQLVERLTGLVNSSLNTLASSSLNFFNWFLNFLSSLPNAFLIVIFTLLATYFFSKDQLEIKRAIYKFFPAEWRQRFDFMGKYLGSAVIGFVRAYAILISVTMILTLFGLLILGMNYAVLMTLAVGIADLLPVLGPGTIFLPWAAILFFQGKAGLAVAMLVLYALVMVVRQVLQPKVVAENVDMHPLEALVTIYVGFKAMGVWGLILGPLLWVVAKAAVLAWTDERSGKNG